MHIKKKSHLKENTRSTIKVPNKLKLIQEKLFEWILNTFQNSVSSGIHMVSAIIKITAIDTYSSKRILEIVDEKSVTNTARFALTLEEKIRFKIDCIQTNNGSEFLSTNSKSKEKTIFQDVLED